MKRFFSFWKAVVFSLSVMLYLVDQLTSLKGLELNLALSIISMLAIATSLSSCKFITKSVTFIFLVFGSWMVWKKGIDFLDYVQLYGEMLYLLSLFAIVPLLSIPIQIGGYREVFKQLTEYRVRSISYFYRLITGLSYFLGTFLNMATIPIVYSSVKSGVEALPIRNHQRFLASSIIQGYSLPILWTPLSGVVGVVLYVTQVSWLRIFPILFLISIVGLIVNWIIFRVLEANKQVTETSNMEVATARERVHSEKDPFIRHSLLQIVAFILLFLILVVLFDVVLTLGLVVIVTLLTFPFAWGWCLFLRKSQEFWLEVKSHFKRNVSQMSELFAIFLSAGFFVEALHFSENDLLVNQLFVQFSQFVGIHLFVFLLPYLILLLSYVGMHPIVVVNLLAQSLTTAILGITTEQMAIALLGGAVMTFFMGPFSGTLGLMSSMISVAPLRIAKWSLVYVFGFSLILLVVIFCFSF